MCLKQVVFLLGLISSALACVPKDFGNDGTVCVCNSTYCDFYDKIYPERGQYVTYTSSKDGLRLHYETNSLEKTIASGIRLDINKWKRYQSIIGYGGAITDAAGINIRGLSEPTQRNVIKSYFDRKGSEYNMIRVPIAGCDFSTRPYSYDDVPGDDSLSKFNLTEEDYNYKIPFIKEALELAPEEPYVFAAAWSPPSWMKTSGTFNNSGTLIKKYYDAYARYIARFVREYTKEGIPIWSVSTGNEPSAGNVTDFAWNCLGWNMEEQAKWLAEYLGPALAKQSKNIQVICNDDQRSNLIEDQPKFLKNKKARALCKNTGMHYYFDTLYDVAILDKHHKKYPEIGLLGTEACIVPQLTLEEPVKLGSWDRCETYASSIITTANHWYKGWVDWNLVLSKTGGPNWASNPVDAPIIANPETDEFYKQPMFYALAHFSKFVPRGSVRLGLQGTSSLIEAVSFLTPNKDIVLNILNKGLISLPLTITGCPEGNAIVQIPSKSVTTFICNGGK